MQSATTTGAGGARVDPALDPYLHASSEEAERCLEMLLGGETDRTIRAIVGRTLLGPARASRGDSLEAEDVRADVMVHLLDRLRRLKADPAETTIESFSAYVATIAYRTCYTHLRRLYPQRARLKSRLRYTLACDPELSLEQDASGVWRCDLVRSAEASRSTRAAGDRARPRSLDRFRRDPAVFAREAIAASEVRPAAVADQVKVLLAATGEPVDLDLRVDGVSTLVGIATRRDVMSLPLGDESMHIADKTAPASERLAHREYLAVLWTEVRQLPANQRIAILLNLRDDDGAAALPLLPLLGVATIRAIADALDMPAADLARLWPSLPLDDETIAARIGLKRQQVINLRKSARQRLGRRMASLGRW